MIIKLVINLYRVMLLLIFKNYLSILEDNLIVYFSIKLQYKIHILKIIFRTKKFTKINLKTSKKNTVNQTIPES